MITDEDLIKQLHEIRAVALRHYAALRDPDQPKLNPFVLLILGQIAGMTSAVLQTRTHDELIDS